jgi:hypothetical protein
MNQIFSHTETWRTSPGHVAITVGAERVAINIRQRSAAQAAAELTRDEVAAMHAALGKYLSETAPKPAAKAKG